MTASAESSRAGRSPEGSPPYGSRSRAAERLSYVALALATLALLALVLGPVGIRLGLWTFRTGFTLLRWAVYLGAPAAVLALATGVYAILRLRGRALLISWVALCVAGAAAGIPLRGYQRAKQVPPINDITTDLESPPDFRAAGRREENGAAGASYPPDFVEQQRAGYPDLAPVELPLPPHDVYRAALAAARGMPRWKVVLADSASGRIEAVVTTLWFGFVDDVAVRVRPAEAGTVLDVRSRSRVGKSDVGANADRIVDYVARVERELRRRGRARARAGRSHGTSDDSL